MSMDMYMHMYMDMYMFMYGQVLNLIWMFLGGLFT